MNTKQVLSIEQMQHLEDLGVDISKATFCVDVCCEDKYIFTYDTYYSLIDYSLEVFPVFTLQDILDLLPTEIIKENRNYQLEVFRNPQRYFVSYYWLDNLLISLNEVELIDAAYEMLCWVVENGYLEKNKQ